MARLKTPMKMRNRIFVFMILTAMPMATVWSTQAVADLCRILVTNPTEAEGW